MSDVATLGKPGMTVELVHVPRERARVALVGFERESGSPAVFFVVACAVVAVVAAMVCT